MVAGGVFINYRGQDSHSYGVLIYAELRRALGPDRVFLDSESLQAGSDFAEELLSRVRASAVLLAVIGPHWLSATDGNGTSCIASPGDWVRRELSEAFAAGVRVIPVLTDDAELPGEAELPVEIAQLGRCQYRRLRHREAIADLRRLRTDLARADRSLAGIRRRGLMLSRSEVVPAQLPADVYGFVGRNDHLDRMDSVLVSAARETPVATVILALSGSAGIGKTALAVHWSHRVADRFPDGQMYINLRGFDPTGHMVDAASAIRRFLDALGVPAERIPADVDAQVALYRSLLVGRRLLVVLDNAHDAEHVRPLLPGTASALTIVTSRNQLTPLVATDGAHPLVLDLLSSDEAAQFLARRLPERMAGEPAATRDVISACARLPLALAIAAARAAQSGFPLSVIAGQLSDVGGRLDALDAGDPSTQMRSVFSWSYGTLTESTARLFRLLGLHFAPDISVAAAASLAGVSGTAATRLLSDLVRASLLTEHLPGRYVAHDLLVAYAADLAHDVDPAEEREAAIRRLLDHYVHTAHKAARLLYPVRDPILLRLLPPSQGTTAEELADDREAHQWLTNEHQVLMAALRLAAAMGLDAHVWQLAWAQTTFLWRRGHWQEQAIAWEAAVAAASRVADSRARAYAHRELAQAYTRLDRRAEGEVQLRRALSLYAEADDRVGQAHTYLALASLARRQRDPRVALAHAYQALNLFGAVEHTTGQGNALNMAGWCHALLGDHGQALDRCEQALNLLQGGDRYGEANAWTGIGYASHQRGHYRHAADCYERAISLFNDLGDRHKEAEALIHLGTTFAATGSTSAARESWTRAQYILTELNHPDADNVRVKLRQLQIGKE